ncbi:MAG: ABC transporter ATP-binding protein [Candidatus Eremiobacteraeota bacterium]|nr:ABC transporter ATP-binding protein [Candidatus Eremiobacteraeota bacterium]MCW5866907.1 ABC transporter ATP-binding protein [Candidatus Eremiobacteraeota bacterium]
MTIESGDFVAITGPSGSGKSSLLNLLGCLDSPTFGQIFFDQRDVSRAPEAVRERIRLQHIGFVFQNYQLLPGLTVQENVSLPMQLAGVRRGERLARVQGLLTMIGLQKQADQRIGTLSGGQQQKVAVARALANLPGLLLADEPTGSLDGQSTLQVMEVIREVNRSRSVTTILVTHDPQVAAYAQKVYRLENGQLHG